MDLGGPANVTRLVSALVLALALACGCAGALRGNPEEGPRPEDSAAGQKREDEKGAAGVEQMSVRSLVGQMFVISVGGTEPDYYIIKMIRERNIGGVLLFGYNMKSEAQTRLQMLYDGFQAMRAAGLPVDCMAPEGAIYLSARLDLIGREVDGVTLSTNEAIREYVLNAAGFAVVPFGAFGFREENGWFRLSVGAVSQKNIEDGLSRLRDAIWRVE